MRRSRLRRNQSRRVELAVTGMGESGDESRLMSCWQRCLISDGDSASPSLCSSSVSLLTFKTPFSVFSFFFPF